MPPAAAVLQVQRLLSTPTRDCSERRASRAVDLLFAMREAATAASSASLGVCRRGVHVRSGNILIISA